jgi:hypothetical protein
MEKLTISVSIIAYRVCILNDDEKFLTEMSTAEKRQKCVVSFRNYVMLLSSINIFLSTAYNVASRSQRRRKKKTSDAEKIVVSSLGDVEMIS